MPSTIETAAHLLVARVPLINDTHKGPVVNLISWITMVTMCLAVITVLISKLVVLRRLVWNDGILIAALVSGKPARIYLYGTLSY